MDTEFYLDAIERECAEIAVAIQAGATLPVPSCPGWRVADLAVHLGVIQRWAAEMVRTRASDRLRGREQLFAIDPDDLELVEWFRRGTLDLVDVLRSNDADTPVWSWTPEQNVKFWSRRQAHEAAVHRWDAQSGVGPPHPVDPALAADGIDEWLQVFAAGRAGATSTPVGEVASFHLHCTDGDGEWVVRSDGTGLDVRREHAKADIALRGTASDLLLFVWGRQSPEKLEVLGNSSLLSRWHELFPAV